MYCTVLNSEMHAGKFNLPFNTALNHTEPLIAILHHTLPKYSKLHHMSSNYTTPNYNVQYIKPHLLISYHTTSHNIHHTTPHLTSPTHAILHYSTPHSSTLNSITVQHTTSDLFNIHHIHPHTMKNKAQSKLEHSEFHLSTLQDTTPSCPFLRRLITGSLCLREDRKRITHTQVTRVLARVVHKAVHPSML